MVADVEDVAGTHQILSRRGRRTKRSLVEG
jgi:hypothetical protein